MKWLYLCVATSLCGFGQTVAVLSPEEAVDRALRSHPRLAASRARLEAAEGSRVQASLRPNPRLYLQSENVRLGSEASPFRYSQEVDTFVYASQVLEAPGKRDSRVNVASAAIRSRELEAGVQRMRLAQNVLAAYWAAVGATQIREVLRESLSNLEQTVDYHRIRVEEGAIAEADLIRVQLEREHVAVQYQNAEQDSTRLRMQLYREIGEPDEPDVVLTGDLRAMGALLPPPVSTMEESLSKRPDLQLARQYVDEADAAVRLEQANAKPDPELLLGYKRTLGFNTLIAGLQIPIPFKNRNQGAIASSLAERRAAGYDLDAVMRSARNEVSIAQAEFDQKVRLLTGALPEIRAKAADTVQIARAVYREGAGDLLRLLDAERTSLQAELLYVRTLIDYRSALIHLQSVTGMLP